MCDMSHHYIITRPCRIWLMCAATIMLIKSAFLVSHKARSPPSHHTIFSTFLAYQSTIKPAYRGVFFWGQKSHQCPCPWFRAFDNCQPVAAFFGKGGLGCTCCTVICGANYTYAPSCTSPIQPFHHFSLLILFSESLLDDKKNNGNRREFGLLSPFLSTSQAFVWGKGEISALLDFILLFLVFLQRIPVNMLAQVESA